MNTKIKMMKWFGLLLMVSISLLGSVGAVHAETTTYTQGGYTLIATNNDPTFDSALKQRMVDTFFIIYPQEVARFNPNAVKTVSWTIDPNYTGVAYSSGGSTTFSASYMKSHPQDIDVVTHESMHIVQAYRCSVDGWVVEGIADYARYRYGVNNPAAGWSLPNYSSSQRYTDGYRVTARFFLWLELRVRSTILTELDAAARGCTYSNPGTWTSLTGQTADQLWARYAADPNLSGPTPTPPPPSGINLALNRPATADSSCNTNEGPAKAVNGSWTGGNSDKWCSLGATKWLRVDLGSSRSITNFTIRHAGAGGESTTYNTRAFNIQLSADGVTWGSAVVNVTNNMASVSTHNVSATARYVRLNITAPEQGTGGAARIYELEVYGSGSAPTPPPSAGVIFYQDINYGGAASAAFAKGDYSALPSSVPNDWMSSLRVPAGWIVDAYEHSNLGGAVCTYTADTAWVGSGCNDRMSSFRIR